MLVQAIKEAKVEDLFGRLEPGQILQLDILANTLEEIAEIPENRILFNSNYFLITLLL